MPDYTKLLIWEGLAFLLTLFGVVVLQVLTGDLRTPGLIEGTTARGSRFVSAARVQLLIVSMVAGSAMSQSGVGQPTKTS